MVSACIVIPKLLLGFEMLIQVRYQNPSAGHFLLAELFLIPFLGLGCSNREVYRHKDQCSQDCSIHKSPFRGSQYCETEIDHAFGGIVRTYQLLKNRELRQRVLRQRRKIFVAIVLDAGCNDEDGKPQHRTEKRERPC